MSTLMLANPRRRSRKTRSPAQRRATRELVAFNRSKKRSVKRRAPRRIERASRIRRRRNPIKAKGLIDDMVMPSAIGSAGAIGLDLAFHFLPLPSMLKTGAGHLAAKGVGAILIGMLAGKVIKKSTANELARGALTVTLHSAAKDAIGHFLPNFALGGVGDDYGLTDAMGYYSPAIVQDGVGEYQDAGIEAAVTPGVGEYTGAEYDM